MQEIRASGELGLTMEEVANMVVLQTQLTTQNGQANGGTENLLQIHNVVNATWSVIQAEYWQHYNFSVNSYMESVRSLLDNLLMQHWAPYETLLDRMMDNAWLSTARRAMDSPNDALRSINEEGDAPDSFTRRSSSVNYLAGLTPVKPREVSTLTFSGFLGIPQPANARLAEARLWNKCRQNIPEVQPLQEFQSQLRISQQLPSKPNLQDPFLFYAYSQSFTADDFDILRRPPFIVFGGRQELPSVHSSGSGRAGSETFNLHEWINAAYLRIFLLFLDAYLIVSRFYGACQNFYMLWLGKRRRILSQPRHQQTQRTVCNAGLNAGRKCYATESCEREHRDEMGGELEPPSRRPLGDQASLLRSSENNQPDLIQTVMQVTKNITAEDHPQSLDVRPPNEQNAVTCSFRGREELKNKTLGEVTSQFEGNKYLNDGGIFWDISLERPATASEKRTTTEFLTFSQRRGLPACCCCLDFHYLLILTGVLFVFVGLALSFSAERSVTNNWLLKRSALLSRLRAMDDYRRVTRDTVDYVQLGYLNVRRLRLERINTEKQLQRLKRLQSRLSFERDFLARQHLQEICSITESEEHGAQRVRTVLESSLCQALKQKNLPYQERPLGVLSTVATEQLKLPVCAFLPVHSAAEGAFKQVTSVCLSFDRKQLVMNGRE
nr:unnamed protein product [Spirometra erinaceieuropaei]